MTRHRDSAAYRARLARAVTECARLAKANVHRYGDIDIDRLFEPVLHKAGIRETPMMSAYEVFMEELDRVFPRRKVTHRWLAIAMGDDANAPPVRKGHGIPRRWAAILRAGRRSLQATQDRAERAAHPHR